MASGRPDPDVIADVLADATVAYGAVVLDDHTAVIECVDHDAFDGDRGTAVLMTALASIGSDLVPFVTDLEPDIDLDVSDRIAPFDAEIEPTVISEFDRAIDAVADAAAIYLIVTANGEDWNRIRTTQAEKFGDGRPLPDPLAGRYVLAKTLIEESSERLNELSDEADADVGETIEVINWEE